MLKSGKIKIYSIRWTWISVYIIFDKRFNYLFHCNFRFSSTHLTGYFKICQVIDCAGCCWCFLCPHLQAKNCFKISLWNRSLKVLMSLFFVGSWSMLLGPARPWRQQINMSLFKASFLPNSSTVLQGCCATLAFAAMGSEHTIGIM